VSDLDDHVPVEVGIVVPVRNMARTLQTCLDALAAQVGAPTHRIVVVDDASTDGSADIAAAHASAPTVIRMRPHCGSYAARNAGAAVLADVEVLAFTDADCVPSPDWVGAGAEAAARHGIVGGAVRIILPTTPSRWALYDAAMHLDQLTHVRDEAYAATANLWVRGDIWRDVGGFQDSLMSGGDLEWGCRAAARGYAVAYAADCAVDHPPRSTALATWRLHRRLGAGWSQLASQGLWPPIRQDLALRTPMSFVLAQCARRGISANSALLVVPHATAMVARTAGRVVTWLRSRPRQIRLRPVRTR
jgi:GT2 family glycosyltransferase